MQQIELELEGGGVLTVSLRASLDAMPAVKERPLVLVVPGGGSFPSALSCESVHRI